jgi:sec-independent protein translocase protein TatC
MKDFFLPKGVYLIANNPLSGFLVQLQISSASAFLIVIPFFLFSITKYIMPALFAEEKIVVVKLVLFSTLFFALGVIFAFTILIPFTIKALFYFTSYLDVLPIFSASDFVSLIFGLILVSGVVFLIPIFMTLIGALGLVDRSFWIKNWRFVFLFFLIFSAIITPDGTGITMLILSLILLVLYFVGAFLSGLKKSNK